MHTDLGIRVREAAPGDRERVTALIGAQLDGSFRAAADRAKVARAVDLLLADPRSGRIFVMEAEGEGVVGVMNVLVRVSTYEGGPVLLIDDLYVDARFRRRGVARSALRWLEDWARAHGYPRIELAVEEGNAAAQALYESIGYVPVTWRYYFRYV